MATPTTPTGLLLAGINWVRGKPAVMFLGVLLLLSWYSTTDGLITVVRAGQGEVSWFWIPVAVLVFALTGLMAYFVEMLFHPMHILRKLLAIVLYLLLAAFSITFGFGFYWGLMVAPQVQLQQLSDPVRRIERQLGDAESGLTNIQDSMFALALRGYEQAINEAQTGRSCDANGIAVCGQRCNWRADQADRFYNDALGLERNVGVLRGDLSDIRGETGDADDQIERQRQIYDLQVQLATVRNEPAPPRPSALQTADRQIAQSTTDEAIAAEAIQDINTDAVEADTRKLEEMSPLERIRELDRLGASIPEDRRIYLFDLTERQINGFVNGYNQFRSQAFLQRTGEEYGNLSDAYREDDPNTFSFEGRSFACEDQLTAQRLSEASDGISGLPPILPADIPRPGKSAAINDSVQRLWGTVLNYLFGGSNAQSNLSEEEIAAQNLETRRQYQQELDRLRQQGGNADISIDDLAALPITENRAAGSEVRVNQIEQRDILPLFTAVMIDIFIFGVSVFRIRGNGMQRTGERTKAARQADTTLPEVFSSVEKMISDPNFLLLKAYQVRHHRQTYIVVPRGLRTQEDRLINTLCEVLIGEKLVSESSLTWVLPKRQTFEICEMLKSGEERRLKIRERGFSDGGFYTYRLAPNASLEILVQYLADLMPAGSTSGGTGPGTV